jgi:hypothetical protein
MNHWSEALEKLAEHWECVPTASAREASKEPARHLRSALAVGVRSEHEALLVLAALGYEDQFAINLILGEVRDGR